MKIRYYLNPTTTPVKERTESELVFADVSNKFATSVDGVVKYSKFAYSLRCYVKPVHFGTLQTKRGKTNYVFNAEIVNKYKAFTSDLRQAILDFESSINDTNLYFRNKGIKPTKEEFQIKLKEIAGRSNELKDDKTVAKYLQSRISYYRTIEGTGKADAIADNTIANYESLLTVVQNFDEVLGKGKELTFSNLKDNYWKLWDTQDNIVRGEIVLKLKEGDKRKPVNKHGIATNTLVTYQSVMRQLCEDALSEGIDVSLSVTDKNLILKTQPTSRQYSINNTDLLAIYNHIPSNERLQKAKDYIIFSSLAGMRLQSVLQVMGTPIQQYNKKGKTFDFVHTVQAKTKTECHTPLFAPAKEVIIRNGGNLPNFSKYSATLNKQIKDLFREAGITYKVPVKKHYYKDGAVTTYKTVDTIVSSHATRKAFVSNLYALGVNTSTAKLVTHPDRKEAGTTDSYNKITGEIRALKFYNEVTAVLEENVLYRF